MVGVSTSLLGPRTARGSRRPGPPAVHCPALHSRPDAWPGRFWFPPSSLRCPGGQRLGTGIVPAGRPDGSWSPAASPGQPPPAPPAARPPGVLHHNWGKLPASPPPAPAAGTLQPLQGTGLSNIPRVGPRGQPGSKSCCRVTLFGNCSHAGLPGGHLTKPLCPLGPGVLGGSGQEPPHAPRPRPAQGSRQPALAGKTRLLWGCSPLVAPGLAQAVASPEERRLWAPPPPLPGVLGGLGGPAAPGEAGGGEGLCPWGAGQPRSESTEQVGRWALIRGCT